MIDSSDGNRRRSLPLVDERATPRAAAPARLGVLSIHLEATPCPVGCEFCYLAQRHPAAPPSHAAPQHSPAAIQQTSAAMQQDSVAMQQESVAARHGVLAAAAPGIVEGAALARLVDAVERLDYDELAIAVSEPVEPARAPLRALVEAARRRGRPVSLTTTARVVATAPGLCDGVARVNLSVDPRKGSTDPRLVERAARWIRHDGDARREIVLIASLVTPAFAERLVSGLLARYLALEGVDKVALNALKPPPAWCGRAFWLRTCARLAPLLREHLDRRLFLDCWVAARILGLGGCPARPDLSPSGSATEFRSCVYSPTPDARVATVEALEEHVARAFAPPAACPFPIPA